VTSDVESMPATARLDLRQTARDAVRAEVRDRAMDLFAKRGFEETKEDVALGDGERWGEQVVQALAQQPEDADPWQAMRDAMQFLVDGATAEPERALRDMRVIMSAPSLRARNTEKHLEWARMLAPAAEQRVGGDRKTRRLRAQVLVHGSIMCLDVAFAEWVTSDGRTSLNDLLDTAFNELR
jgi:hypothetical protein